MKLDEQTLNELTGVPVRLADRTKLPFERLFAQAAYPEFSRQQYESRMNAVRSMRSDTEPLRSVTGVQSFTEGFAAYGGAWFIGIVGKEPWTGRAVGVGRDTFGASYDSIARSHVRIDGAVIFPNSPVLSSENYWKIFTGLNNVTKTEKDIDEICLLEQAGAVLFYYSRRDRMNIEVAYLSRMVPDVYAIRTYLNNGGNLRTAQGFIDARRLAAFFDETLPRKWTAAACEAAMWGKDNFPSLAEAFDPIRELQICVYDDLRGNKPSLKDKPRYADDERIFRYFKASMLKQPHPWYVWRSIFRELFEKSPSQTIASLDRMVKDGDLSQKTRAEGRAISTAYKRFFAPRAPSP